VRVYGYTRSWSKIGSALSVVIAAVIVLATDRYAGVFLLSIVPYVANVVNLATYPRELDLDAERPAGGVMGHLRSAVRDAVGRRPLRRLLLEAMGFDGVFTATKDYLQPVLEAAAVATITAAALGGLSDTRRTAILVAPVYAALFLLAGAASRQAHRIPEAAGGEDRAAHVLWIALAVVFAAIGGAAYLDLVAVMIVAFVALHVVHNLWRPVLIARFDTYGEAGQGAALLSIESQGRRIATIVIAPLLGIAVDAVAAHGPGGAFWPVGAVGLASALVFVIARRSASPRACS
jgi:hypothetical protein